MFSVQASSVDRRSGRSTMKMSRRPSSSKRMGSVMRSICSTGFRETSTPVANGEFAWSINQAAVRCGT